MKKTRKTGILKICLMTVLAIFIDIGGKALSSSFSLPMWLDSLGTIAAGYALGPLSGAVVGLASNVIQSFIDGRMLAFGLISIGIGISAGLTGRKGGFHTFFSSMTYAVALMCFTFIVSSLLSLYIYRGNTGNAWGNAIISFCTGHGIARIPACFIAQFYLEFVDKTVTVITFYFFLKVQKHCRKARDQRKFYRHMASTLVLLLALTSFVTPYVQPVQAEDMENHIQTVFNEKNGLLPGHATDVVTTRDGLLWIGTYAGLYSYNGEQFTRFESDVIGNVNCLFTDSEGRLWVGTNDAGLAIIINHQVVNVLDVQGGLCSDSVRSVVQTDDGMIYVGTSSHMQVLSLANGLSVTGDIEEVSFAASSARGTDGYAAACGGDGKLYLLKQGKVQAVQSAPEGSSFTAVCAKEGNFLAGTDHGEIYSYAVSDQGFQETGKIDTDNASVINEIASGREGDTLLAFDNGLWRILSDGSVEHVNTGDFTNLLQRMITDYQGNLWIASTRQGLLEISPSAYADLFVEAGMDSHLVNAVMKVDQKIYAACDDGLFCIDQTGNREVSDALCKALAGTRVRALAKDRQGNLYAASYGQGLLSMDPSGKITRFEGTDSPGQKVRTVLASDDQTVYASGENGIVKIVNGQPVSLLTYEEGLGDAAVLSLCEGEDGALLASTDGNGFFLLKDGKIAKHYERKDGLGSGVVLKIRRTHRTGIYFLVLSNGLAVLEKDGKVRRLENFPYTNNYDIIEDEKGNCYVTGSAGIYITSEADLLEEDGVDALLSGTSDGMPESLTVNSGNFALNDLLYLSGSRGIIRVDCARLVNPDQTLRLRVRKIEAGGIDYQSNGDDALVISGGGNTITVYPEVINFSPMKPSVRYRLNGWEEDWHTIGPGEVSPVTYEGMGNGDYSFVLEVLDGDGQVVERNATSFTISEELYERKYFIFYLVSIILLFVGWITWFITHYTLKRKADQREQELAVARRQIEMGNESVIAMAKALFSKDRRTGEHCHRVTWYASRLAAAYGFSEAEQRNLRKAALLHDIGKIAIPDAILNKPGRLTDEEYEIMKSHTTAGADILKGFTVVKHVSEGARYHHERYDGKGYPSGLFGENIPLYGRIIAVADAFDAMTARRVYRDALDMDNVVSELEKGRGTQFDPYLDDLFLELIRKGDIDPVETVERFRNRDLTEDIE